jgi:hypothetical protein
MDIKIEVWTTTVGNSKNRGHRNEEKLGSGCAEGAE